MNTIDNLMALADQYAMFQGPPSAREALRAALVEALAQPAQPEWNDDNVIAWCVARGVKAAQPAPRKSVENVQVDADLIQHAATELRDKCGGRCNAEYNPCWALELADRLEAALAQPNHIVDANEMVAQPEQQYNADPSCTTVALSEMILSDCGCSSNNTSLVSRVANRIDKHMQAAQPAREPHYINIERTQGFPDKLDNGPQMILYSDSINGCMVRRDDVWLALTSQLQSSQPAREPLTTERIYQIAAEVGIDGYEEREAFARAIEREHRIGGEHE